MWIDYIKTITDDYSFEQPADEQAVSQAESTLGHPLPKDLRELLSETNGIKQDSAYLLFILPVERIEKDNYEMRNSKALEFYMPFENLLFFADAGNGDKFGFPISKKGEIGTDVFSWNHEDDSRSWCASTLEVFIKWWHEGKIKY